MPAHLFKGTSHMDPEFMAKAENSHIEGRHSISANGCSMVGTPTGNISGNRVNYEHRFGKH